MAEQQTPEDIVAEKIRWDFLRMPTMPEVVECADSIAKAAVQALRDAGYLPDGTESCPEGHDADGELAQHYRRVGPWVPVEEEK